MVQDAEVELGSLIREHGAIVESEGWRWAARMRAERRSAATLADVVERGLASRGEHGLLDLVLAGPALGGLGAQEVAAMVRAVRTRIEDVPVRG